MEYLIIGIKILVGMVVAGFLAGMVIPYFAVRKAIKNQEQKEKAELLEIANLTKEYRKHVEREREINFCHKSIEFLLSRNTTASPNIINHLKTLQQESAEFLKKIELPEEYYSTDIKNKK